MIAGRWTTLAVEPGEVLRCLEWVGGGVKTREVAYQLGRSEDAVVQTLSALELSGLVALHTGRCDRHVWQVTPAGREQQGDVSDERRTRGSART